MPTLIPSNSPYLILKRTYSAALLSPHLVPCRLHSHQKISPLLILFTFVYRYSLCNPRKGLTKMPLKRIKIRNFLGVRSDERLLNHQEAATLRWQTELLTAGLWSPMFIETIPLHTLEHCHPRPPTDVGRKPEKVYFCR